MAGVVVPFRKSDFAEREAYRPNYVDLAAALVEVIAFDSILDVGCGQGLLLEPLLQRHGVDVHGIELSPDASAYLPESLADRVTTANAAEREPDRTFDLVTSIEVAEHVPETHARDFVRFLTGSSRGTVYFTAAIPRQSGHGHINCQPSFYWIDLFGQEGYSLDVMRTRALIERIRGMQPCYWIPQNSLIFARR